MRNQSRKLFISLLLATILFAIFPNTALGAEKGITSIDIDVELASDGSAVITEIWNIRDAYDGTEYYIGLNNMTDMDVLWLKVWDETGRQFETQDNWNIDASMEEKAYKCGTLQTAGGYELCWGISSYDDHVYTVRYGITGLVKGYSDYAGFYHQFVASDLSSPPESVSVTIHMPEVSFSENNTGIWAYGYEGEINFREDGYIYAYSGKALSESSYVNVRCRFDSALFTPLVTYNESFDNATDTDRGSGAVIESGNSTSWQFIVICAVGALSVVILAIILAAIAASKLKLSDGTVVKKPSMKEVEVSNELPFNASLPATYYAFTLLHHPFKGNEALSSYLLKWESDGYIQIEEQYIEKNNMGKPKKKIKKETAIIFSGDISSMTGVEKSLYEKLLLAARQDGFLTESRLAKWSEKNYDQLQNWMKELKSVGKRELIASGIVEKDAKGKIRFTGKGYDKVVRAYGFLRYIKEYADLYGADEFQADLWGDYLIFATLLGISDQVASYYETYAGSYGYHPIHMYHIMLMTNSMSSSTIPNADTGAGGSAMMGGGGGFSGGGGGGGSR